MPTTQELVNEWSDRFQALNVSNEILTEAFNSKQDEVDVNALFTVVKQLGLPIRSALELVMVSEHLSWFKKHLETTKFVKDVNPTLLCSLSNTELLLSVLDKFPNVLHARTSNLATVFHSAADLGNQKCLLALCEKYPDLKYNLMSEGESIAHRAAMHGRTACLLALLKVYPEFLNMSNNLGDTVAHVAAKNGQTDCLITILRDYPELKFTQNIGNENVAEAAAACDDPSTVLALLELDPVYYNQDDVSLSSIAVFYNNTKCIMALLDKFSHVRAELNHPVQSPISRAIQQSNANALFLILEKYPYTIDKKFAAFSNSTPQYLPKMAEIYNINFTDIAEKLKQSWENRVQAKGPDWKSAQDGLLRMQNMLDEMAREKSKPSRLSTIAVASSSSALTTDLGLSQQLQQVNQRLTEAHAIIQTQAQALVQLTNVNGQLHAEIALLRTKIQRPLEDTDVQPNVKRIRLDDQNVLAGSFFKR